MPKRIIYCSLQVKVGDRTEKVRFFHCYKRGVDRVFVDHPIFLAKVGISDDILAIHSIMHFWNLMTLEL